MSRLPRDDRKAFDQAALPHLTSVYRAALALCGKEQQAEDLAQATFLKALENFGQFQAGTNCRAWLMRILRNTWIDSLRKSRTAGPAVSIAELEVAGPDEPDRTSWSDAKSVLDNFSDQQVIAALGDLPDDQRLALYLADVEQMPLAEVAQIMDVPAGTIKSRTSRARAALRRRLMAHARDLGFVGRMK
ncbi:MAG: sigma-70 family RNA polymerase sigma factor [Phycisphaerae bacterium]